jgi:Domain of unknown function (DUF1823)
LNIAIKIVSSMMLNLPPLNTNTIWAILKETVDDDIVNQLVWQCLGYQYNESTGIWDGTEALEQWRQEYPQPPNFIESRPATVKLTRSTPAEYKQLLKEELGFEGYKLGEFGPRQTRRATAANWLLSYMKQHQ